MGMDLRRLTSGWSFPSRDTPLEQIRWSVVDTETTGLDLKRDRIISLGTVDVCAAGIPLGRHFEAVLNLDVPLTRGNVMIHRITPDRLRRGREVEQTYQLLLEHLQMQPLLAFHAAFDKHMLEKELRQSLGKNFRLPFADVAFWARALFPEHGRLRTLDEWLKVFHLNVGERHQAILDAFVTAQLALICLERARMLGLTTWGELDDKVRQYARLQEMRGL